MPAVHGPRPHRGPGRYAALGVACAQLVCGELRAGSGRPRPHAGPTPALAPTLVPSAGVLQQGIVAGTRSAADDFPATGVILYISDDADSPMGDMICSGTLVAPDVVLAAGHCQEHFERPTQALHYYFSRTLDVSHYGPHVHALPSDAVRVNYFLPHPDYDARITSTGLGRAADLGLFFLDAPVAGVAPAALAPERIEATLVAGARVTIVGYGRRLLTALGTADGGIKHQGESTIHAVGPYEMHVGRGVSDALKCHGDSGGPTYMLTPGPSGPTPTLVGITSRALGWQGCVMGGVDTRVDAYLPWIADSLAWGCAHGLRAHCPPAAGP